MAFFYLAGKKVKITPKVLTDIIVCDQISKNREGDFIFRRGYFYRHGMDSGMFAARIERDIKAQLPGVAFTVTGDGDHWAPFRGGDSVKQGSHFWVTVHFHEALTVTKEVPVQSLLPALIYNI